MRLPPLPPSKSIRIEPDSTFRADSRRFDRRDDRLTDSDGLVIQDQVPDVSPAGSIYVLAAAPRSAQAAITSSTVATRPK